MNILNFVNLLLLPLFEQYLTKVSSMSHCNFIYSFPGSGYGTLVYTSTSNSRVQFQFLHVSQLLLRRPQHLLL